MGNPLKPIKPTLKPEVLNARRILHYKRKYEYLLKHSCVDCGAYDPAVLEFDHVRGIKTADVSYLISNGFKWETIETEIQKCDIRCKACHAKRHGVGVTDPNLKELFLLINGYRERLNITNVRFAKYTKDITKINPIVYVELQTAINHYVRKIRELEAKVMKWETLD